MPTPVNLNEKAAFIAIVNAAPFPQAAAEAARLQDVLVYYEDIVTAIGRTVDNFAANNGYLTAAMACFDDVQLQNVGIWNNKSFSSPPLTDPVMIINSDFSGSYVELTFSSPFTAIPGLAILGTTRVGKIILDSYVNLQNLYLGPGSVVDLVDSTRTGSFINNIWLTYFRSTPSILNNTVTGSQIGNIDIYKGSYYGGPTSVDIDAPCATPVTSVTASERTHNSILLQWVNPANQSPPSEYLTIAVYFKKTESAVWELATDDTGDYINDSGYVFRSLEEDTFYDFKISVTCLNGGVVSTLISAQTICCGGGGSEIQVTKDCLINVVISDAPDPTKLITLCNGIQIYEEYPSGATLTIPYLAYKTITDNLVIDNATYQDFPYDPLLGQWDASSTPVLTFVDGNIVSIRASLPI